MTLTGSSPQPRGLLTSTLLAVYHLGAGSGSEIQNPPKGCVGTALGLAGSLPSLTWLPRLAVAPYLGVGDKRHKSNVTSDNKMYLKAKRKTERKPLLWDRGTPGGHCFRVVVKGFLEVTFLHREMRESASCKLLTEPSGRGNSNGSMCEHSEHTVVPLSPTHSNRLHPQLYPGPSL